MLPKTIASVFVMRGEREPMMIRLASAIERRAETAQLMAELADEPTQPGLEKCDRCDQIAQKRGDHYSVHYPSMESLTPCPRSWPPKVKR